MGMWQGLLISDTMKVTLTPTDKHEGLSWMAGGKVRMGNIETWFIIKHM